MKGEEGCGAAKVGRGGDCTGAMVVAYWAGMGVEWDEKLQKKKGIDECMIYTHLIFNLT